MIAARAYPTPCRTWSIEILSSGLFPGISDELAARLWRAFERDVFRVIADEPNKLTTYAGIPASKIRYIQSDLARFREVADEYFFLCEHGISPANSDRIVESFSTGTRRRLTRDPFAVLRVSGIEWRQADALAMALGMSAEHPQRLRSSFEHVFWRSADRGYTALPRSALIRRLAGELRVPHDRIAQAIASHADKGLLVERNDIEGNAFVAMNSVYEDEIAAARELARLLGAPGRRARFRPSREDHFLVDEQRHAIASVLENKVVIITGGPGVGKTTVLKRAISHIQGAFGRQRLALVAPTGKAAQRMYESIGIQAQTIHTALEFHPKYGFRRDASRPLDVDLVVIDEFSMVDLRMFVALLNALPDHVRVIIVGDRNQLASVAPGAVLRDLIASGRVPVAALTEVHRQAADSQIITNAYRAIRGDMLDLDETGGDFHWIDADNDAAIADHIERLVGLEIPDKNGIAADDIQVITPRNGTIIGVDALNRRLHDLINPRKRGKSFRMFGEEFRAGDRIMQIKNDKKQKLSNGDTGLITGIDHSRERVWAQFNGVDINFGYRDFEKIRLAYSITIHKSQGSEYGAIIIPISASHAGMLNPQLLYTAMTRGKRQVYLVGQREALKAALANKRGVRRHTLLTRAIDDTMSASALKPVRRLLAEPSNAMIEP